MTKTTQDFIENPGLSDCLMNIMPFLVWSADMDEIHGGVHARDALASFRHILGWEQERFDALCDIFRQEPE